MEERFLLFRAGGEGYALRLQEISEVMEPQRSYPLPGAPPHFLGLINFHGALTALVDLAAYLQTGVARGSGALLVMDSRRSALALRVDAVAGIVPAEAVSGEPQEEGDASPPALETELGKFRLLRLDALLAGLEQGLGLV